jgi:hypothetical protein
MNRIPETPIEQQVRLWLEQIVIGLNLCPFAGASYRSGQIRIHVSQATNELALLEDLRSELERINSTPAATLETTILVVAGMLADFADYNVFLDEVDVFLRRGSWDREYQVASFHPQYRFEGTDASDAGNLTNRAPWPLLHIIREASIDQALSSYPDPDAIPERNMKKMSSLTPDERRDLFPWLFNKQ